jgi:hypothetical protein
MFYSMYELQAAEAHRHELEEQAEHERLIQAALRARKGDHADSALDRLLRRIKASRREMPPSDQQLN